MKALDCHEDKQRGSQDFPLEYHFIDGHHPRYEMPYHWHEEVEILRVLSGEFPIVIDDETHRLRSGDTAYIASGRLHGGKPESCVYECIVFDMRLLLQTSEPCRPFISDVISRKIDVTAHLPMDSPVTRFTIAPLCEALRTRCEGCELITLGCLYQFMGDVLRHHAYERRQAPPEQDTRGVWRLKTVFELIENRPADPPTLGELSASVGMSPKYFCRFFKSAAHRTPLDYIGFYRIEQACREMVSTEKNVTEIAMDMGYGDVNYFIRCFKKYKGVTPKQYMLTLRRDV